MQNELIIYKTDDGKADIRPYVWMNQQQPGLFFDISRQNISMHIANVLQKKKLDEKSVVMDYLTTDSDGKNYTENKRRTKTLWKT